MRVPQRGSSSLTPRIRKARVPVKADEYAHKSTTRKNNPPVGLVKEHAETTKKTYYPEIDPHDSPFIMFKHRENTDQIKVPTVQLHVHESIQPLTILEPVLSKVPTLDDFFGTTRPHNEAVEFYEHEDGWANRLIAGDSLLVMNSLLEKENMAGRVQMVYFDPPYGITYNSNFQPIVSDTGVKDKAEYVEMRPEQIKAFRDTWELGIHSYLAMIRKRLTLVKNLLTDTGSVFVQISTKNQHLVRVLLDEVFGPENFMWQILFRTKGGGGGADRPNPYDYILWYAKNKENAKFNKLWKDRTDESVKKLYKQIRRNDGTITAAPKDGKLPKDSRFCKIFPLHSQGVSTTDGSEPHTFPNGKACPLPYGSHWRLGHSALDMLYHKDRIHFLPNSVGLIGYPEDSPELFLNIWEGMQMNRKQYVVETKSDVIQNCMLMCSDVGDLVIDITGGSGVTAYTAEQWGRRWITCDTSRVSLATIRIRLQTATYPWYRLVSDTEGVSAGLQYEEQPRLTPKSLSEDDFEIITRYDKPKEDKNRTRVTGPFTMESIPAPTVSNKDTKTGIRNEWVSMLQNAGIVTTTGRLRFDRVRKNPDNKSPIHAFGTLDDKEMAVSFGPEHGPMGRYQVESVLADLGRNMDALFIAMAFDPVAKSIIDKTVGAHAAHMNNDILIQDLKSTSTDQPFSMVGEPDIKIVKNKDGYVVELLGYDYYDITSGQIRPGDANDVAMWMLDTDYDGRTLRVKQLFFPNNPDLWRELERTLRSSVNPDMLAMYSGTVSIPFLEGNHKRVAVKTIDKNGNEALRVEGLGEW